MKRTCLIACLLAACHQSQPEGPRPPDHEVVQVDAAPPVAEAPPDAAVPVEEPPPPPPLVAPVRPTEWAVADADLKGAIKDLKKKLKAEKDPTSGLILRGRVAALEWRQTCKGGGSHGLCIAPAKARKKKVKTCAAEHETAWVATKRTGDTKTALADLKATIALWKDGAILDDAGDLKNQVAMVVADAMMALADAKMETYFAVTAPTGLDFDKQAAASTKRFDEWFMSLQKTGAAAHDAYQHLLFEEQKVVSFDPEAAIIAVVRIAQISDHFSEVLVTAEVPKDVAKDDEKTSAFCDTLAEKAEPLVEQSKQAWGTCVQQSALLGVVGEWADLCAARMAELAPAP